MKIDSKIISVSSGSELPFKAQNLIKHFETHGTPVMIGEFTNVNFKRCAISFLVVSFK